MPVESEGKSKLKFWLIILLSSGAALLLGILLMGPLPPDRIRLATGNPGGAYDMFGKRYRERLGENGLAVDLVTTNGSIENLEKLLAGEVDLAFVQGGTYRLVDDQEEELRGLATLYREPLWVFYRRAFPVEILADLKGRTISIGSKGSGTESVARLLLHNNGIGESDAVFKHLAIAEASSMLLEGTLHAAFFVSSHLAESIHRLLRDKSIGVVNFRRHIAYARMIPHLSPVELTEGMLSLEDNIPDREITLLAPSALLACRSDLDGRVAEQILNVARQLHTHGSAIDLPGRYPSLEGVDLPRHPAAEAYLESGESFLSRILPYWGLRIFHKAKVLILPFFLLLLPFTKLVPLLYRFRVNQLLRRLYIILRDTELSLRESKDREELRRGLDRLDGLREEMERISRKIPGHFQRDVYHWRLHISLVRTEAMERFREMEPPT